MSNLIEQTKAIFESMTGPSHLSKLAYALSDHAVSLETTGASASHAASAHRLASTAHELAARESGSRMHDVHASNHYLEAERLRKLG